jgi:hypothetical protein
MLVRSLLEGYIETRIKTTMEDRSSQGMRTLVIHMAWRKIRIREVAIQAPLGLTSRTTFTGRYVRHSQTRGRQNLYWMFLNGSNLQRYA